MAVADAEHALAVAGAQFELPAPLSPGAVGAPRGGKPSVIVEMAESIGLGQTSDNIECNLFECGSLKDRGQVGPPGGFRDTLRRLAIFREFVRHRAAAGRPQAVAMQSRAEPSHGIGLAKRHLRDRARDRQSAAVSDRPRAVLLV